MEPGGTQAELQKKKKYLNNTDESLLYDPTNLYDVWISLLAYIIMERIALCSAVLEVSISVNRIKWLKMT